jgi:8-oxo-dGTP pyrophosphatase MutT (NUDIX family)
MATTPTREPSPLKDAATLLLLREGDPFEIFMVRRHGRSRFMGGMYVFPGGKRDETDSLVAHERYCRGVTALQAAQILGFDDSPADALGHFIAAVRETFEEAGILLAVEANGQPIDATAHKITLDKARAELQSKQTTITEMMAQNDWKLALDKLRYYAHWVTPELEPSRFSARFFISRAPDRQLGTHDSLETTASAWITPSEALKDYNADRFQCGPPTLRVLEEMAAFGSLEEAIAAAPHHPVVPNAPQFAADGDIKCLVLPDDPLHPDSPGTMKRRFVLDGHRWRTVFNSEP